MLKLEDFKKKSINRIGMKKLVGGTGGDSSYTICVGCNEVNELCPPEIDECSEIDCESGPYDCALTCKCKG